MSKFHELIKDTKKDIKNLINKPDELPCYMNIGHLEMIIKELDKMDEIRDVNIFFPYYPKGITDCWDRNDMLGEKLLEILTLYREWRTGL